MTRPCMLCGTAHFRKVFDVPFVLAACAERYSLLRCNGCGLLRTDPWPENLRMLYESNYHEERRPASRRLVDRVLRSPFYRVPARLSSGRPLRVLDFGCGTGEFLDSLSGTAWERWGYDISETAAAQAPAGVRMVTGELRLPSEYFDAVFSWEVLEHLPDPLESLRRVTASLRPGGLFIASVPDADSLLLREFRGMYYPLAVPFHLHHFDRRTLTRLLKAAGLTPVLLQGAASTLFVSRTLGRRLGRLFMAPAFPLRGLLRVFNLFGPSWKVTTSIVALARKA